MLNKSALNISASLVRIRKYIHGSGYISTDPDIYPRIRIHKYIHGSGYNSTDPDPLIYPRIRIQRGEIPTKTCKEITFSQNPQLFTNERLLKLDKI